MASEKTTLFRTNEEKTEVVELLPKTVTSQVYDVAKKQFLDETLSDLALGGGGGGSAEGILDHVKNKTKQQHIEVVTSVPDVLTNSGIIIKVEDALSQNAENVTLYRTNEEKTKTIEQLPKTVTSQVYDGDSEQFLDETLAALSNGIEELKNDLENLPPQTALPSYGKFEWRYNAATESLDLVVLDE